MHLLELQAVPPREFARAEQVDEVRLSLHVSKSLEPPQFADGDLEEVGCTAA